MSIISISIKALNLDNNGSTEFGIQLSNASSCSVADLRHLISEQRNIPLERIRLLYLTRLLEDHELLDRIGITNNSIIHMVHSPPDLSAPRIATSNAPIGLQFELNSMNSPFPRLPFVSANIFNPSPVNIFNASPANNSLTVVVESNVLNNNNSFTLNVPFNLPLTSIRSFVSQRLGTSVDRISLAQANVSLPDSAIVGDLARQSDGRVVIQAVATVTNNPSPNPHSNANNNFGNSNPSFHPNATNAEACFRKLVLLLTQISNTLRIPSIVSSSSNVINSSLVLQEMAAINSFIYNFYIQPYARGVNFNSNTRSTLNQVLPLFNQIQSIMFKFIIEGTTPEFISSVDSLNNPLSGRNVPLNRNNPADDLARNAVHGVANVISRVFSNDGNNDPGRILGDLVNIFTNQSSISSHQPAASTTDTSATTGTSTRPTNTDLNPSDNINVSNVSNSNSTNANIATSGNNRVKEELESSLRRLSGINDLQVPDNLLKLYEDLKKQQ